MPTSTNPTNLRILCFYISFCFTITYFIIIIYKTGGGGALKTSKDKI